jgi:hypothetical protein
VVSLALVFLPPGSGVKLFPQLRSMGGRQGLVAFAHLPRQRRNGHPGALALQDVTEVFKVRVAAADDRVAQLEGGNVGARVDLVRGVHCAWGGAVGLWVLDLRVRLSEGWWAGGGRRRRREEDVRRYGTSISRKFSGGP